MRPERIEKAHFIRDATGFTNARFRSETRLTLVQLKLGFFHSPTSLTAAAIAVARL